MINARQELVEHIGNREVDFVRILLDRGYGQEPYQVEGTLEQVIPLLNFTYDDGYGAQELFGYIWYTDGTWSERREYDGSEWWCHKQKPSKDIVIYK